MARPNHELTRKIVEAENWFPQSFADVSVRPWGMLFHAPGIPESHDANHACILNHGGQPAVAVQEVISFYGSRGSTPRVNLVASEGDDQESKSALMQAGFVFEYENAMHVYLHRGPSEVKPNREVIVQTVNELDVALFEAIAELNCPRVAKVLQRRLRHEGTRLFVGSVGSQPVSIALLEPVRGLWRVDEVHTHETFRGRGCARAVIHALVQFFEKSPDTERPPLYLWTDNPVAERLYAEAGFERLDLPLTSWISWLKK